MTLNKIEQVILAKLLEWKQVFGPPGPLATADILRTMQEYSPSLQEEIKIQILGAKATITPAPTDETFTLESKRATQALLRKVMS